MFQEALRRVYPELSPRQRLLADYITQSYRQVAFMTAARVAEAVAMNEATVIRFAQRLGYQGYPQMQEAIQATLLAELDEPSDTPEEPQSLGELFDRCLRQTGEQITSVRGLLPHQTVEQAVTMLTAANDVVVVGAGEGAELAGHIARQLDGLGLGTRVVGADVADLAHALASVRPGVVWIGCGGAQGSTKVAAALALACGMGARTLAFSHTLLAPEAHTAETAIALPGRKDVTQSSLTVLCALADALIMAVATARPDAEAHGRRVAQAYEQLQRGGA